MTEDILFSSKRHLGLITLNRPQALNALTLPMILAMQHQLHVWKDDPAIHAVVIQAAEGKAFCAGGDVRSLYDAEEAHEQQMQFFWHEYRLNHFIHHFQKPYIALMDGVTLGGGVGIALHGSHPVATEKFQFAMPETSIGFFPDIGASFLLSKCPGSMGLYLGLTGHRLHAEDARAAGLVKHLIRSEQKESVVQCLLDADLSTDVYQTVDACLNALSIEPVVASLVPLCSVIDTYFGVEQLETLFAQLSDSEDPWQQNTLETLHQKSPLSLAVTWAQLHKARGMSLADCLHMDYCLAGHFMRDHDFYEGIRALLVDKDKSPRWQPKTLTLVTPLQVSTYFECGRPELPFFMCDS